ncbi:hypothetical protein, partial [Mycoplasmopsis primatum]|uniref:hypothetical protein n=1 Tax=Mycoplasmopsis primatum TaxID=55604 RepID=UPI00056A3791
MDKKKKGLIIGAAVLTAGAIIATPIIVIKNNKTKGKNNVNENFVLKINEYKEKIKIFTKINSQNEVIELNSEIKSAEDATRKGNLTKEEADLHLQKIEDAYNKALVALDNFNIKTKKDELSKKIQEITTNLEQFINPNLVLIKEQVKKALTHAQTIANNNTSSLEDLDKELKNLAEVFDS